MIFETYSSSGTLEYFYEIDKVQYNLDGSKRLTKNSHYLKPIRELGSIAKFLSESLQYPDLATRLNVDNIVKCAFQNELSKYESLNKDNAYLVPGHDNAILIYENKVIFANNGQSRYFYSGEVVTCGAPVSSNLRCFVVRTKDVSDEFLKALEALTTRHDPKFLETLDKVPVFACLYTKSELKKASVNDNWLNENDVKRELNSYFDRATIVKLLSFWKKKHGVRRDPVEKVNYIPPMNIRTVLKDLELATIIKQTEPKLFAAFKCLSMEPDAINVFLSLGLVEQF